jgi:ribosome-binding factor A|tara:strand:+ start:297 stop:668 length:372 start_codon:yes stop_codon:yes gene_type:complete
LKPQRPFKRTDRVGEQILEIITDTAARYIDLSHLGFVTFTGVDLAPDFKSAKIYFSVLNPTRDIQTLQKEINAFVKAFKRYLGPAIRIKHIPDLRFIYDESLIYSEKMNQIIQSVNIPKDNDT